MKTVGRGRYDLKMCNELQTSFCSRIAFLNFPSQLLFVCYVINIASSFVPVHTDDYFIRGTALPGGGPFFEINQTRSQ